MEVHLSASGSFILNPLMDCGEGGLEIFFCRVRNPESSVSKTKAFSLPSFGRVVVEVYDKADSGFFKGSPSSGVRLWTNCQVGSHPAKPHESAHAHELSSTLNTVSRNGVVQLD